MSYYTGLEKNNIRINRELQKTTIARVILRCKNTARSIMITNIILYYRATVTKTS